MAERAEVRSIEALRAFKAALKDFDEAARQALGEAQGDVMRTGGWLQNDRAIHWKQQLRYRQNRLADARSELMRAEIATATRTSAVVERKNVEKWKHAVEEAEQKLEAVKRWLRLLEREATLFKGKCQPLARTVEGELPKAYATLDRLYEALEKYLKLAAPAGDRAVMPRGAGDGAGGAGGDGDEAGSAGPPAAGEEN